MKEDLYPQRRKNRLPAALYRENGAYFITICTRDKQNLFWTASAPNDEPNVEAALRRWERSHRPPSHDLEPDVGAASRREARSQRPPEPLNANGHVVQREISKFSEIYHGLVTVDNFVIMPNHVHLLLSLHPEETGGRRNAAPTISSVVNQFKGCVTKAVGSPCWQKSFHDRIVRDEREYLKIWEYIDANPGKWTEDRYYIPLDESKM